MNEKVSEKSFLSFESGLRDFQRKKITRFSAVCFSGAFLHSIFSRSMMYETECFIAIQK